MAGHLRTMAHSQKQSVLMILECSTCKFYVLDFWQVVATEADESGIELVVSIQSVGKTTDSTTSLWGGGDVFVMIWRVQVAWIVLIKCYIMRTSLNGNVLVCWLASCYAQ